MILRSIFALQNWEDDVVKYEKREIIMYEKQKIKKNKKLREWKNESIGKK